jgi:hypothetical protein
MAMSPRLLRPRATGFNPKSISGLQLWLDAADSSTITTETGVSEWRDKSVTGSKWAQTTGNNQPATGTQTLNGRNVIVFDGSNDSLSATTPLLTSLPMSFFFVQQIITSTSFGMSYVGGSGSDDFNIRQSGGTGALNIVAANSIVINQSTPSRVGVNDILAWIVPSGAGTNSTLHRNGTEITLTGPTLKPVLTGTHYIGRRSDGFYANIWVAEVIVYSTLLSASQRKSVEAYLGKKWGITVT